MYGLISQAVTSVITIVILCNYYAINHLYSKPFTKNRILLLHYQLINEWQFGLVVTALVTSTQLLYVELC